MDLDARNKALITELEKDGRASIAQVARSVRLNKETAAHRIAKLQREKVITKFATDINYYRVGYSQYGLLINLCNLGLSTSSDIAEFLRTKSNIDFELCIQSNYDLFIRIWAKNDHEFIVFSQEFNAKFANHVQRKDLSIITKVHQATHAYLHGNHAWYAIQDEPAISLTEKEHAMIELLKKDGRMGLVNLASELQMPVSTARYHLSRLQKVGAIVSFRPHINESALGYSKYLIAVDIKTTIPLKTAITFLKQSPNVIRIYELIGHFDFIFEAHCTSIQQLDTLVEQFRVVVPDIWDFEVMLPRSKFIHE